MKTLYSRPRLALATFVLILAVLGPAQGRAQPASELPTKIAAPGLGDRQNSFAWSMAWFKGKLYIGTNRNFLCVENATLDYYFGPGFYSTKPIPEVDCPANRYDLDLRAEIWQFTPETQGWKRVFQSPETTPLPPNRLGSDGKDVTARDIGFRNMGVYQDALYVGGVTSNEYIPENRKTNPPRILRSTDGETFEPLMTPLEIKINSATVGEEWAIGYRAMAVYDDRLFVTAGGGLLGDGVVLEVLNPSTTAPTTFVQRSPNTLQIYEMEPFDGELYVGVGDTKNNQGYSVHKMEAQPDGQFTLTPVVTGGAGRGNDVTSVVSMHVYKGRLYVGSNGWYTRPPPPSELIRINPDDSWDLVVGLPRLYWEDLSFKYPISGEGDGFGNQFNAHFWRMQCTPSPACHSFNDLRDQPLYLGTNDFSWALRSVPDLGLLLSPGYGFDAFGTCDGQYWWNMTSNAFGDGKYNFGLRTMAWGSGASGSGHFMGSANHAEGTSVWENSGDPCLQVSGSTSSTSGTTPTSEDTAGPTTPTRLLTDVQACGTVLSWDPSSGAVKYRVLRAEYQPKEVFFEPPPTLPQGGTLEGVPPKPGSPLSLTSVRATVWIPGPFSSIGTTAGTSLSDRNTTPGARYVYQVVAEDSSRAVSGPSNSATVPSQRPAITFDEAESKIGEMASRGKLVSGGEEKLLTLLSDAGAKWQLGDREGALTILDEIQDLIVRPVEEGGQVRDPLAREDLRDVLFRLQRWIRFFNTSCS